MSAFLLVYHRDGSTIRVLPQCEAELDAALEKLAGEGSAQFDDESRRDSLVSLTTTGGERYRCLASSIYAWMASTPESRQRERDFDAGIEAENPEEAKAAAEGNPAFELEASCRS